MRTGGEQDGLISAPGLTERGWALFPACGHTGFASSHAPPARLPPPALRAEATVARETRALDVGSRRDRSARRPSPVYTGASVSQNPSRSSVRVVARAAVSWHGANRNCSTADTGPVAGVTPARLCIRSSPAGRLPPHAGGGKD